MAVTVSDPRAAARSRMLFGVVAAICVAILLTIAGLIAEPTLPRRFLVVFGAFAVLLAAYVALLTFGPPAATPQGSIIQATGQKIIAYASIAAILLQSLAARSLLAASAVPGAAGG